jgi:hypothetical protein
MQETRGSPLRSESRLSGALSASVARPLSSLGTRSAREASAVSIAAMAREGC